MSGNSIMTRTNILERTAFLTLLGFVATLQLSIAVAQILLTITGLLWGILYFIQRDVNKLPRWFIPLALYALATLGSAAFSLNPVASFMDSKQLLLFLIVPIVCRLARGERALTVATIIISIGAASAIWGIVQFGILEYDHLGRRPQGWMSHYMTYAGLLMVVSVVAVARVLFHAKDRTWSALVIPAVLVAIALTLTRSAWVGTRVGLSLLLVLKDFRLLAALPVLAALFFGFAPPQVTDRLYSTFDLQDPTNRDRLAMARTGVRMIQDYPLTGVGPNMVQEVYVDYRDANAVQITNPHLHNVPMQIAAERGLPALALWLWFVLSVVVSSFRRLQTTTYKSLPAGGLAALAAMLAAGLFEYNFGDSEFLMMLLVIITLPYAADTSEQAKNPL
ncbi:MAG: O-antigen ligase family protein [Acidobacteriota bacterium]|nr:O-antigen ligase family protein [Acidobacteriota bacterium]